MICSRFEQNYVSEIQSKAFTPYGLLKRIDLSNNNISEIAYDAFAGLKYLTSLWVSNIELANLQTYAKIQDIVKPVSSHSSATDTAVGYFSKN